jgi:hypothetical protein
MVRASMDVGIHNVSIHGWVNVRYRTTCCLPAAFPTTNLLIFPCQAAYPTDPRFLEMTYNAFVRGSSWRWLLWEKHIQSISKRLRRKKKPRVSF